MLHNLFKHVNIEPAKFSKCLGDDNSLTVIFHIIVASQPDFDLKPQFLK